MGTLGVHQNIPASDTKLTTILSIDFINPPLVMDKLIPVNSRANTSHRRRASCLRSNARLQLSLNQGFFLLRTWITLVGTKRSTSRDKCTFNLSTGLLALLITSLVRYGSIIKCCDQFDRNCVSIDNTEYGHFCVLFLLLRIRSSTH